MQADVELIKLIYTIWTISLKHNYLPRITPSTLLYEIAYLLILHF